MLSLFSSIQEAQLKWNMLLSLPRASHEEINSLVEASLKRQKRLYIVRLVTPGVCGKLSVLYHWVYHQDLATYLS